MVKKKINRAIPLVTEVELKGDDVVLRKKGRQCIEIRFDEIYNSPDNIKMNKFIINRKKSHMNAMDQYCDYVNYFIKYYDLDNELIPAYFKVKFLIDGKNIYKKRLLIEDLYYYILTPTMVDKIKAMTENNYVVSLEKKKYDNSNKLLQFKDCHGKMLFNISMAMKIFNPLINHYMTNYKIKGQKGNEFLLKCYSRLFDVFDETTSGEGSLYDKLYEIVLKRLGRTENTEKGHWAGAEIRGKDLLAEIDDQMDKIVVDIIQKYDYNQNIIHLIYTVMKKNIYYMTHEPFKYNYNAISNAKDSDGLMASPCKTSLIAGSPLEPKLPKCDNV